MKFMPLCRFCLALVALIIHASAQEKEKPPAVGDQVDNLRFTDIRFLPRTLADFKDAKGTVIAIVGRTCPIVQRYLPRLSRMERKYRSRGIRFLALNPIPGESVIDVASHALEYDVDFPFAKDFDAVAVRALGADRLGGVVVLDANRHIVYRGRVDSQYRLGGAQPQPGRSDLAEALEDLLAKKTVRVPETPVDGCLLATTSAAPPRKVTFTKDVAPLLQKHCQICHRPAGEAPFPLITFQQARGTAGMLGEVVRQHRMPPWYANPAHGVFTNKPTISARERQTLVDWVRNGSPEGSPEDLPQPRKWPETRWRIGKPDLVLVAPKDNVIPAEGFVPYQFAIMTTVFKEDTWVEGVEILASNPKVMHHANLFWNQMGFPFSIEGFIAAQVPGGDSMMLGKGTGFLIPKNSFLCLSIHYVTTGKEERDRISVGLVFSKQTVERRLHHLLVGNSTFEIPPG